MPNLRARGKTLQPEQENVLISGKFKFPEIKWGEGSASVGIPRETGLQQLPFYGLTQNVRQNSGCRLRLFPSSLGPAFIRYGGNVDAKNPPGRIFVRCSRSVMNKILWCLDDLVAGKRRLDRRRKVDSLMA